jgi:hypothetical protein
VTTPDWDRLSPERLRNYQGVFVIVVKPDEICLDIPEPLWREAVPVGALARF